MHRRLPAYYLLLVAAIVMTALPCSAQRHHSQRTPLPRHASPKSDSIAAARVDSIWQAMPDVLEVAEPAGDVPGEIVTEEFTTAGGHPRIIAADSAAVLPDIPVVAPFDRFAGYNEWEERDVLYNPSPTRAVWLSALFPGLGQVYNRRFWKLPIIVGGYMGLGYATSWNNTMLRDYSRAYRDIMDTDPNTKSYMDFFPSTVKEENLDKTWLTNLLKARKDYFRRNRDLCIICMVGVYFLAMVDAYVDASLAHFDITPDLTVDWAPTFIPDGRNRWPSVGLQCAFTF